MVNPLSAAVKNWCADVHIINVVPNILDTVYVVN